MIVSNISEFSDYLKCPLRILVEMDNVDPRNHLVAEDVDRQREILDKAASDE